MKNEALKRAVGKFTTLKAFAEALSTPGRVVTYQMVQQWMTGAVPAEYCPDIERISQLDGIRIALRPNDGHRIWPEIAAKQAPKKHGRRKDDKPQRTSST